MNSNVENARYLMSNLTFILDSITAYTTVNRCRTLTPVETKKKSITNKSTEKNE